MNKPQLRATALSGAALLLVFWLDLVVSNDVSLFPLYLLPIGIATYSLGGKGGYLVCLLQPGVDSIPGHVVAGLLAEQLDLLKSEMPICPDCGQILCRND